MSNSHFFSNAQEFWHITNIYVFYLSLHPLIPPSTRYWWRIRCTGSVVGPTPPQGAINLAPTPLASLRSPFMENSPPVSLLVCDESGPKRTYKDTDYSLLNESG